MFRYLLFLIHARSKPPLLAVFIVFPVLTAATFLVSFGQAGLVGSSLFGIFMTVLFFCGYLWHCLRFGRAVRGFRLLAGKEVLLRYPSNLEEKGDLALLLQKCEESLLEFKERFGFSLKRDLVVFLFPTPAHLSRLFKMRAGGSALIGGDAIILTWVFRRDRFQEESIRHELAHLFSHYWGRLNPPLKGEGLATWLQGSLNGKPVDMQALAVLLTDRVGYFSWILDPAVYYRTHLYGYTLAGSFTGFLIRRFGWDSYRTFFERSNARNFTVIFQKIFGLSLVTAERQWRDELLSQRQSFEPDLSELVRKRNIESAFNSWQLYRCLELADELIRPGQEDITALGIAARAHAILGHYERATELMKRLVQSDDPSFRADPSAAWLFLGELHDLLDQRDEAITAYQQCLACPDGLYSATLFTHALARRHLKAPFTENELLRLIGPRRQGSGKW
jgi:tetratricopeptide (TPR) repeat protein